MENFLQSNAHRCVVGLYFHQWCHVIPPLADDRRLGKILGCVVVGELLHCEKRERLLVEKNRVVRHPGGPKFFRQLGQISACRRLYSAARPGFSFILNAFRFMGFNQLSVQVFVSFSIPSNVKPMLRPIFTAKKCRKSNPFSRTGLKDSSR